MNQPEKPNIFTYGTSELTQDAFFAWLFAWLENEHFEPDSKQLQEIGLSFLRIILGYDVESSEVFGKTKVYRQKFRIDVIISLIGLNTVIIIEDKIHGKDRVEKQQKYSNKILNCNKVIDGFSHIKSKEQIKHAYLKTGLVDGEDLLLKKELKASIIDVEIINQILNDFQINNDIFNDYKSFIEVKANKREECKELIFTESKFDKLKTHEGQQVFFNNLINEGLQSTSDDKPYLKLGTSRGKPWAELWIVKHSKPVDWEFEDAIFYRLEKRKVKKKPINYLSIRQYHRYDKDSLLDSHAKKIRYDKLRDLFESQLTKFNFNNSISPLSDKPKNYGSDFGAFVLMEGQINIKSFSEELIRFNNSILDDIQKVIFT
jgi:hypothetical protein